MKLPRIDVRSRKFDRALKCDVLFIPVVGARPKVELHKLAALKPVADSLADLLKSARASGVGSIDAQVLPAGAPVKRVAVVACGEKGPCDADAVLNAAGACVEWCRKHQVRTAAVMVDALQAAGGRDAVSRWVEGFLLGAFRYTAMRAATTEGEIQRLVLATSGVPGRALNTSASRACVVADSVNLARFLGHEPANVINPVTLAARCRAIARQAGLRCRVIDERTMQKNKMGAILAVGQGSATKPRIIILEHTGGRSTARPVVLLGKAVTFDTGGYSIKPTSGMVDMKYDKCGAMAVIGALVGAARLKLRKRVIGVIGAAENMISRDAYRPGDIIRAANGKTIEVLNTDAEGRLVLADCLHHAEKTWKPSAMVELSTLTGAIEIALGNACAGLMCRDDRLAERLLASGERSGDRVWRLPLWPVYREQIAGTDSDIKNVGGRAGGSITAGIFLQEFVSDKTPFAHLDIAAMASTAKKTPICPVGATGFGVRLLLDYLGG